MLFNSLEFAFFLPVVFILYWFVIKELKFQNILLLGASYFFYGWWDWRFLSLIVFSSFVDYLVGVGLGSATEKKKRRLLLLSSVIVNLGFLGFFKYFNFFTESFADAFTFFGMHMDPTRLEIILPVGISFYTFQTLSYSIDVYRKKLEPTNDIISFFAFVSFFPQLVAGPIERATKLLPQFYSKRVFNYSLAVNGLRQILWGLIKKIVIADSCAEYANMTFNHTADYGGSTLALGALFFAFQIYGDFSGYSDIAIGTSRLFGFNLMKNFSFPYFSRDMAEFWRRWHISLSTWFRDYLYIPLGGSKGGLWSKVRNIFIIFLVSGFWHGANWTFIVWGLLNAIYFLPLLLLNRNRKNIEVVSKENLFPHVFDFFKIIITFSLTVFAWIFFRADNLPHAFQYIEGVFSVSLFSIPHLFPKFLLVIVSFFMFFEWIGRHDNFAIERLGDKWPKVFRYGFYYMIIIVIIVFSGKEQEFIYFQF
jgi:alginate O-acetyltransferase complex protein AlgI